MGQYGDVFGAQGAPGLLLLHAPGNVFIRDLQQGQTLLIQPSSLLYRDVTVRMALHLEYPRNMGFAFWHSSWSYRSIWVRLWGPGRVAVQSVYQPPEDTEVIRQPLLRHDAPLVTAVGPYGVSDGRELRAATSGSVVAR